jgi:hypothetical protein
MVGAVLAGRLDKSHAASSCRCLSAWLRLDVSGAGGRLLSLGDMYSQQVGEGGGRAYALPHSGSPPVIRFGCYISYGNWLTKSFTVSVLALFTAIICDVFGTLPSLGFGYALHTARGTYFELCEDVVQ